MQNDTGDTNILQIISIILIMSHHININYNILQKKKKKSRIYKHRNKQWIKIFIHLTFNTLIPNNLPLVEATLKFLFWYIIIIMSCR